MKLNKEEQARREGMAYALKIAREKGIDGLEEELKFRNCTRLPIGVKRSACDEAIGRIKEQTCDTFLILTIATLNDEFGFGQKRAQQFIDRFEFKAVCLGEGYCTWEDHVKAIKDELKLELRLRLFNQDVKAQEVG